MTKPSLNSGFLNINLPHDVGGPGGAPVQQWISDWGGAVQWGPAEVAHRPARAKQTRGPDPSGRLGSKSRCVKAFLNSRDLDKFQKSLDSRGVSPVYSIEHKNGATLSHCENQHRLSSIRITIP